VLGSTGNWSVRLLLIRKSHEIFTLSPSFPNDLLRCQVKAKKNSDRLGKLEGASRNVNGATARVVASTKAGRRQLDEAGESLADLASAMTLTQIKRREMDSQVTPVQW